MSKDLVRDVQLFNEKFDVPLLASPGLMKEEMIEYRLKFLEEELFEIQRGFDRRDLEEVFDGLIDLVYVAIGTSEMMGLPFNRGWDEVQACNMSKVKVEHASESKRGSSIDVVKPPNWTPPDFREMLK